MCTFEDFCYLKWINCVRRIVYVTAIVLSITKVTICFAEVPPADSTTMTEMMNYLSSFGYVAESGQGVGHLQTAEELTSAIRLVQRVANLPETGLLDEATASYIARPRCGVSDERLIEKLKRTRRKRYVVSKYGKWQKKTLTWSLKRTTNKVSESRILHELLDAFRLWSDGSSLEFRRVSSADKADIELDFFRMNHYDSHPFDGLGGILAHAFFPGTVFAGALHFDDDERWMTHSDAKTAVAHELGHILGLDHSADYDALMTPSYPGAKDVPTLPGDDLMAIQELYGASGNDRGTWITAFPPPKTTKRPPVVTPYTRPPHWTQATPRTKDWTKKPRPPTPSPPTTTPAPEVCPLTFDTISSVRGELMLFKNKHMWRITRRNEIYGPSLTHQFWRGLPSDLGRVDAVYERQTRGANIVFFIGQQYWVFDGNVMLHGYPRPLTDLGLPDYVKRIDATLVWGHNGKTYFFAGDKYWKFNEAANQVDADYPRDITVWRGVPSDLTAAVRWEYGITYFFKGKVFWKFDNAKMEVEHTAGRLSHPFWIDCLGKAYEDERSGDSLYGSSHRSGNSLVTRMLSTNLIVVSLILVLCHRFIY